MLSAPLTCCSIGAATLFATTSAGRARVGGGDRDLRRRDVGILRDRQTRASRAAPPSVMTIEMTDAKIGRSMQKWEMFMFAAGSVQFVAAWTGCGQGFASVGPRALRRAEARRGRRGTRTAVWRAPATILSGASRDDADRAVDHDALARLQAVGDEPVVAVPRADFDHALMRLRVLVDDPHEVALRALQHRALRHQDRVRAHRARHPRAHELAGPQRALGIREATRARGTCRFAC